MESWLSKYLTEILGSYFCKNLEESEAGLLSKGCY